MKTKIFFIGLALALVFLLRPTYAEDFTNVSILYGWNGTNFVPLLVNSSGQLLVDINITSTGLNPKTNNTYSLGSSPSHWANTFTTIARSAGPMPLHAGGAEKVSILASGNVGIGDTNPQQTLVAVGQANITGTAMLNGTTVMRGNVFNWPSSDGGANSVLTTNGGGGLSWNSLSTPNISARNVTSGSFGAEVGGGFYSFPANLSVVQNISASDRITDKTGYVTPVGMIVLYSGALAPAGWLIANGSEVNRTVYPDLFNITGTRYGNTSDSTFILPDLRQRIPLGKADSGTGSTLGGTGGSIDHTHTGPSHTHTYSTVIAHTHTADPPSTTSDSQGSHTHTVDPASTASGTSSHTHSADPGSETTNSAGGGSHRWNQQGNANGGGAKNNFGGSASNPTTSSAGGHSHTYDIDAVTSGAEASHTHSTDIASFDSASGGGSTHSTDIDAVTTSSTGSASGTSDAGGTGATGTGNVPFIALYYIIKY